MDALLDSIMKDFCTIESFIFPPPQRISYMEAETIQSNGMCPINFGDRSFALVPLCLTLDTHS